MDLPGLLEQLKVKLPPDALHRLAWPATGAITGALTGALATSAARPDENDPQGKAKRRARILRNALMLGALGAGAGASLQFGGNEIMTAAPPERQSSTYKALTNPATGIATGAGTGLVLNRNRGREMDRSAEQMSAVIRRGLETSGNAGDKGIAERLLKVHGRARFDDIESAGNQLRSLLHGVGNRDEGARTRIAQSILSLPGESNINNAMASAGISPSKVRELAGVAGGSKWSAPFRGFHENVGLPYLYGGGSHTTGAHGLGTPRARTAIGAAAAFAPILASRLFADDNSPVTQ